VLTKFGLTLVGCREVRELRLALKDPFVTSSSPHVCLARPGAVKQRKFCSPECGMAFYLPTSHFATIARIQPSEENKQQCIEKARGLRRPNTSKNPVCRRAEGVRGRPRRQRTGSDRPRSGTLCLRPSHHVAASARSTNRSMTPEPLFHPLASQCPMTEGLQLSQCSPDQDSSPSHHLDRVLILEEGFPQGIVDASLSLCTEVCISRVRDPIGPRPRSQNPG
jgi:hypothetical protein